MNDHQVPLVVFFRGPRGRSMCLNGRRVHASLVPIQLALLVEFQVHGPEQTLDRPIVPPASEAPMDRLPRPEPLRKVMQCGLQNQT